MSTGIATLTGIPADFMRWTLITTARTMWTSLRQSLLT